MGFWEKVVEDNIKKKLSDIEQINIKSSKEAVADVLNDNPEEMPDEIPEEEPPQQDNQMNMGDAPDQDMGMGPDMGGGDMGGSPDSSSDMGGTDMSGTTETEEDPNKIQKNEFSDINNKILIIESYDRILETIKKAQELFKAIPELNEKTSSELEKLCLLIEDEKSSVGLYTKAENYIRYRLFFSKTNNFIKKVIEEYRKKFGISSKEQLNILENNLNF